MFQKKYLFTYLDKLSLVEEIITSYITSKKPTKPVYNKSSPDYSLVWQTQCRRRQSVTYPVNLFSKNSCFDGKHTSTEF